MNKLFTYILFLFTLSFANAQEKPRVKRELPAVRTIQKITIDGHIKDTAWQSAAIATNLVEWRPTFGKVEDEKSKTEIYFLYDNDAIYIGGFCHEVSTDSISKELVGRDVVGVNDFVGVMFDTYNDQINGFGYYVTPLGEQFDAKYSSTNGEDPNWSTVYETATQIVAGGWTFEMKIPYSAIRFGNKKIQDWGINITRKRNKAGKQFMWNPVDPTIGGTLFSQFGKWTNIQDIKPPLRLSFSPYFSTYANHFPVNQPNKKNWASSVNGGMDIKYGITPAFTLDMTLIPDFGQVQSDNLVLNLSPFEIKFSENRPFFTEGTELFGKGNLFYSRRIGGEPLNRSKAANTSTDTVLLNPAQTKLINATKLSGRTQKGLGIGFFNAVVDAQFATIENKTTKQTRDVQTNPLTNYNIIVLDQTLKNNSSVSFINTNTMRAGSDYDANVAAALFDIYDKKNNWNVWGKFGVSQLFGKEEKGKTTTGINHNLGFGKFGGRFNFNINQDMATKKYDQNDMGYFTNNNYLDHNSWIGYKWVKPGKWYNNLYLNLNLSYSRRLVPGDYQSFNINTNINGQLKNLWYAGFAFNFNAKQNDFYEPRKTGYVFKRPANYGIEIWGNTNRAKKYSAELSISPRIAPEYKAFQFDLYLYNQYRFNKKLTISLNNYINPMHNNLGFATLTNDSSVFALRERITVENTFNIKYNFTNKMGLSFRARHYWSKVENNNFFLLQNDGLLKPIALNKDVNTNVNFFNIDMVYTWQFALGSFVNIVWKNAIGTNDQNIQDLYLPNFKHTLDAPQNNSFSVRIIYFLDYLNLKKKKA
jgi:hypothetical protein